MAAFIVWEHIVIKPITPIIIIASKTNNHVFEIGKQNFEGRNCREYIPAEPRSKH
jgi:hypothetical protein